MRRSRDDSAAFRLLPELAPLDAEAAALRDIPNCPGVYVLLDPAGRPILLAATQQLRRAVAQRVAAPQQPRSAKAADLRSVTAAARWRATSGRFESDLLYLRVARRLYPDDLARRLPFAPAWLLRADSPDATPHLVATTHVPPAAEELVGPFATRRDAERYARRLEDVFDLCRYPEELKKSPRGRPCAYFEMGRCPAPCDGSSPLEEYRRRFRQAVAFAHGEHGPRLDELRRRMQAAAATHAFEAAASLRETLQRAQAAMGDPAFRIAAPFHEFRWLIVQPAARPASSSGGVRLHPFFVIGHSIAAGAAIDLDHLSEAWPQWAAMLNGETRPAGDVATADDTETADEVVWLATHYLFRPDHGGLLMLRATQARDAATVGLHLRQLRTEAPPRGRARST